MSLLCQVSLLLDTYARAILLCTWPAPVRLPIYQSLSVLSPISFHSDPHPGNLLKVTEGPHAGKLALLDFGLVAEIPTADREAMVSATIHLANRGT